MKDQTLTFLGIDVAKAKFDAFLLRPDGSGQGATFANNQTGFTQMAAWLRKLDAVKVHAILEATGPYSLAAATFLYEQQHTVSVVNPARPKSFAQARGCRNKTDSIDCCNLAAFGQAQKPEAWQPASEAMDKLRALVRRREDVIELLRSEKLRREGAALRWVSDSIQRVCKALREELAQINAALEEHFASQPQLQKQRRLLCTIQGVGQITAAKIIAELGDPARFGRSRQAGAFAGLTPKLHQSGKNQSTAGHICKIGSPLLRAALYMSALTAIRCNPRFMAFAQKLRATGKRPKVIICAVMRRLVVVATAMLRSGKEFDPNYCTT